MSDKKIAIVAIVIGAFINSTSPGMTKVGLFEIPPLTFAFLRFVIASLCILPFFIYKKGHKFSTIRDLVPLSLLATINIVFFAIGIKLTTANIGGTLYAAVPLLAGLILFIFFKKSLAKEKIVGIIIGFIGVLLIALLPLLERGNIFAGNLLGNMLIACGVIFWSLYMVYSKKLYKTYSPFITLSSIIFTTTIALIPFFLWELYSSPGWWNTVTISGISSVFYVGIFISVLAYLCVQYAIKHGGAVLAGTTFYITPVLGVIVNFLLLGEQLTPGFVVGSILALIGTYLVVRK